MESEEAAVALAPQDASSIDAGPARPRWYASLPEEGKRLFQTARDLFVISSLPDQNLMSKVHETANKILKDNSLASQATEKVFGDIRAFPSMAWVPWLDELLAPVQASLTTVGSSRLLLEFELQKCMQKLRITIPRPPEVPQPISFGWVRLEGPKEVSLPIIIDRLLKIYSAAEALHTFPTNDDSQESRLRLSKLTTGENGVAWFGVPSAWKKEDSQQWETITLLSPNEYAQLLGRYKRVWEDKDNNYLLCNPLLEEASKYAFMFSTLRRPVDFKLRKARETIIESIEERRLGTGTEEVEQMLTPALLFHFHRSRDEYTKQYDALRKSHDDMKDQKTPSVRRKIREQVIREITRLKVVRRHLTDLAAILLLIFEIFETLKEQSVVIPEYLEITQTLRNLIRQANEFRTKDIEVADINLEFLYLERLKPYVERWPNPEVLKFVSPMFFLYRKFYNDAAVDIEKERVRRRQIEKLKSSVERERSSAFRRSVGRARQGSRSGLQMTEKLSPAMRTALRALPAEQRLANVAALRRRQKEKKAELENFLGRLGDIVVERRGFRQAEMRALDRRAVILAPPPPPPSAGSEEGPQDEQDRLEDAVLNWSLGNQVEWRKDFANCPPAWASDRRWEEWKYNRMMMGYERSPLEYVPRYPSTSQAWFGGVPPTPATDKEWTEWLLETREKARGIKQTVPLARRTLSLLYHNWCDSPTDCRALEKNRRALSGLLASEGFKVDVIVTQGRESLGDEDLEGWERATMTTGEHLLSFHWKLRDPTLELLKVEKHSDKHVGVFRKGDELFTLIHALPLSSPESPAGDYSAADAVLGSYSADAEKELTFSLNNSGFQWVRQRARSSTMVATQVRASYVDFVSARPGTILGPVRTATEEEGTRSPMYARFTKTSRAKSPDPLRRIEARGDPDDGIEPVDFEEDDYWDPYWDPPSPATNEGSSDVSGTDEDQAPSATNDESPSESDEEFKGLQKSLREQGLIQGSRRHNF